MKYVANKYYYVVEDLNDVDDLDTIICDNEPYDTVEFDTMDEAFAFVRCERTDIDKRGDYYRCEAWVAEPHPEVLENEAVGCHDYEVSKPVFAVEFDIYHGGIGVEAVFDNYRDALDELETCERAADAAGDEDIEFSIRFYNPYPNEPCVPYRPEPLPEMVKEN